VNQAALQIGQFLADWEHNQGFWVMVGALSGALSALVITVAAAVAWFQLREAQNQREAQDRPFVVIDFYPEATSIINFRISNIGKTVARDVRFRVHPPFVTKAGDNRDIMKLQVFQTGIRSLAPGRVIEFLFDTWIGRDGLTERHEVTITYAGAKDREYTEVLDLDLGVFRNMEFIRLHGLNDIYKELEKIAGTLSDFTAWSGKGLLALSPDDLAKREQEFRQAVDEERAEREKEKASQSNIEPMSSSEQEIQKSSGG